MRLFFVPFFAASAMSLTLPRAASAAPTRSNRPEATLFVGGDGGASSWRADPNAALSARVGLQFARIVGAEIAVREGYGSVDDRVLTHLSVALAFYAPLGRIRPYARVGGVHQHETPFALIRENPISHPLGVGEGIRHRAGATAGVGVDFEVGHHASTRIFLGPEATASTFLGNAGPATYFAVGARLGVGFAL